MNYQQQQRIIMQQQQLQEQEQQQQQQIQQQQQTSFVTKLNKHDVLLGRGSRTLEYEGNVRFRKLIKKYKTRYTDAVKRCQKDSIAREIIKVVTLSKKGRFLKRMDEVSSASKKSININPRLLPYGVDVKDIWVYADEDAILLKVKQAFRNCDSFLEEDDDISDSDDEENENNVNETCMEDSARLDKSILNPPLPAAEIAQHRPNKNFVEEGGPVSWSRQKTNTFPKDVFGIQGNLRADGTPKLDAVLDVTAKNSKSFPTQADKEVSLCGKSVQKQLVQQPKDDILASIRDKQSSQNILEELAQLRHRSAANALSNYHAQAAAAASHAAVGQQHYRHTTDAESSTLEMLTALHQRGFHQGLPAAGPSQSLPPNLVAAAAAARNQLPFNLAASGGSHFPYFSSTAHHSLENNTMLQQIEESRLKELLKSYDEQIGYPNVAKNSGFQRIDESSSMGHDWIREARLAAEINKINAMASANRRHSDIMMEEYALKQYQISRLAQASGDLQKDTISTNIERNKPAPVTKSSKTEKRKSCNNDDKISSSDVASVSKKMKR